jgi:hypothetical protein
MAATRRVLETLAALERRYDGPIPEPLRQLAYFGSITGQRLAEADGQRDFFTRLVRDQLKALRRARRAGAESAGLAHDLAFYRRRRQWWRREAARLRSIAANRPP